MRNFINQETVFLNETKNIELSSIFKWYASDFNGKNGIRKLLSAELPKNDARRSYLMTQKTILFSYRPYQLGLNN